MSSGGVYPMRIVTRLTGLSPDTIRAWERRYSALVPVRTEGNARRYRDEDIRRLSTLAALTAEGHSISTLAPMTDEQLTELARGLSAATPPAVGDRTPLIDHYLAAIRMFEAGVAEERLVRAASLLAPREVALDLVAPLLREVGERWHESRLSVAEEHLVSAQVRALLGTLLRTSALPRGAARMVTAAPPQHLHDIGALIAAILCTSRGVSPVHLGADVPYPDLARAARHAGAQVVLLTAVRDITDAELAAARAGISAIRETAEVWIGAPTGHRLATVEGVRAFDSFESFDTAVLHRFPGG